MNKLIPICRTAFLRANLETSCRCLASKSTFLLSPLTQPTSGLTAPRVNQIRFYVASKKSSKGKSTDKYATKNEDEDEKKDKDSKEEENDDDDDEDETLESKVLKSIDTSSFKPGYKIIVKSVPSLRLDAILSTGLNLSRNKIDDQFYSGRIRLNGVKVTKKSASVKAGDRVDLIGDSSEKNSEGKRSLKRVILERVLDKTKNDRPRVALVTWKTGLFEEDSYKI